MALGLFEGEVPLPAERVDNAALLLALTTAEDPPGDSLTTPLRLIPHPIVPACWALPRPPRMGASQKTEANSDGLSCLFKDLLSLAQPPAPLPSPPCGKGEGEHLGQCPTAHRHP